MRNFRCLFKIHTNDKKKNTFGYVNPDLIQGARRRVFASERQKMKVNFLYWAFVYSCKQYLHKHTNITIRNSPTLFLLATAQHELNCLRIKKQQSASHQQFSQPGANWYPKIFRACNKSKKRTYVRKNGPLNSWRVLLQRFRWKKCVTPYIVINETIQFQPGLKVVMIYRRKQLEQREVKRVHTCQNIGSYFLF